MLWLARVIGKVDLRRDGISFLVDGVAKSRPGQQQGGNGGRLHGSWSWIGACEVVLFN